MYGTHLLGGLFFSLFSGPICIMHDFAQLQGAFRSFVGVGYKTLEILLIELHQGKPSRDLLLALLNLLVDGSFQPSNMVIQVLCDTLGLDRMVLL